MHTTRSPRLHWMVLGISALLASVCLAADTDSDGLDDTVETNTGGFVSASNTGTNPNAADSDGDGVPDGLEGREKTSPVDATRFNGITKGLAGYLSLEKNSCRNTSSVPFSPATPTSPPSGPTHWLIQVPTKESNFLAVCLV